MKKENKKCLIHVTYRQVCGGLCIGLQWVFQRSYAYLWNLPTGNRKIQTVIEINHHNENIQSKVLFIFDWVSMVNQLWNWRFPLFCNVLILKRRQMTDYNFLINFAVAFIPPTSMSTCMVSSSITLLVTTVVNPFTSVEVHTKESSCIIKMLLTVLISIVLSRNYSPSLNVVLTVLTGVSVVM